MLKLLQRKLLKMFTVVALLLSVNAMWGQNVSATWGSNGNTAWYTTGNWVGSKYAGVQGTTSVNENIATFTSAFTGTSPGINMNTSSLSLGAISIENTRTTNLNIGNSSGSASGTLNFNGTTVNNIANVIIRHNGRGDLTLQASQSGTMGVVLKNITDNIINIDNTGNVIISSIISGTGNLTKAGSGTGILTLSSAANTFTGITKISTGELRFNPSSTIASYASPVSLSGGTLSTTGIAANTVFTSASSLSLETSSTLALDASSAHSLKFAASNNSTWSTGTVLTITGWTGTVAAGTGTKGKLFIGTSASGLTANQLSQIKFIVNGINYPATILSTGEVVPTLNLAVTNPGNQTSGTGFSVTVTAKDYDGITRNIINATGISLSSNLSISGTTTGTISAGTNSITISGVTLSEGNNATITATRTSGDIPLTGTSTIFNVLSSGTPNISTSVSNIATALTTVYGSASSTNSFSVSGSNLTAGITISAPNGFEIATDGAYSNTLLLPISNGSVNATTVYIRITGTALVGSYSGNVTLNSTNVTEKNIALAPSSVTTRPLTITGLTGTDKVYDASISAVVNGDATLSGIVNNDAITIIGAPSFSFNDKLVANNKNITVAGYGITGSKANNYTLAQPTGLTGNITAKTVTISNATVSPKTYDGTNAATVSGTINTISGTDNLVLAGTYATVNAGAGITVNLTLSGTDAGNYYLAPTSTTGTINKATPVYTSTTISLGTTSSVTVTGYYTTTSDGVLTYSIANTAVATISGTTITAGSAVANTTLTVNQAASTNYNAGSINNIPLNVTSVNYVSGDYRTAGDGVWSSSAGNNTALWQIYNGSGWSVANTSPYPAINNATNTIYIANTITLNGSNTTSKLVILDNGLLKTSTLTPTFGTLLIKDGGTFQQDGYTKINTSLEVENGGTFIFNSNNSSARSTTIWNGTEKFHPLSIFRITKANSTAYLPIDDKDAISENTFGTSTACFGIIEIDNASGKLQLLPSGFIKNLTHGDLIFKGNSDTTPFSAGSFTTTIGGNLIFADTYDYNYSLLTSANTGTLTIKGNLVNNSTKVFTLFNNNSTSNSVTVNVEGDIQINSGTLNVVGTNGGNAILNLKRNLSVASGALFYSSYASTPATINFTGTTPQTVSFASTALTLNQNINFNIKSGATTLLGSNFVLGSGAKLTAETGSILNLSTYALTDAGAFESKANATIITSGGLVSGIVNAGTKTFTAGTNYTFNGVTTTPFPLSTIGNTGIVTTNATVTLNRNITSQGNIVVNTGTFNLDAFTIDRNTAGGSLSIATDATLKIGGTNGFPANYNTLTFSPNSTVEYGGQAQQVGNLSAEYKNVVLSGTGAKSFVNGTIVGNNLTLQSGPTVTIPSNTTITVGNSLINNATAENFVINNNGALLQTGTGVNTGAITVLKNTNPLYRLDYTMWAAPVENQKLIDFSSATALNRFYEYKYATNAQNQNIEGYWSVDASNVFSAAKGYLIRMPNTDNTAGYTGGTATLTFEGKFVGKPHTGNYNITASTAANRFTAVGNPYPSPIGVEEFYAQNSDVLDNGATIFLWRKRNSTTQASSYAKLTRTMFTANGSSADVNGNHTGGQDQGTYFSSGRTFMLAAGQGFIVKTKNGATATDIKFTNSMRKAATADGQAFLRTAQTPASRLWINIAGPDGGFSQSGLAYLANATTGIDYGYDGKQLIEQGIVSLYSVAEGTALVIQARPDFTTSDVVPMGYNANIAGNFTISIDHTDGLFAAGQNVYLKDKTMGITRNISETDYTFTTEAGTFEDRFELVYTTEALGTDNPVLTADNLIVYKNGESININAGSTRINAVTVFDIRGRKLYSQQNVNNTEAVVSGLTVQSQVLIVEIATEKGIVSKKIIF